MNLELQRAFRELKADPCQPVRVLVEGMVVELQAVRVRGSGRMTSPWTQEERARDIEALDRVARLIAAARALDGNGSRSDA